MFVCFSFGLFLLDLFFGHFPYWTLVGKGAMFPRAVDARLVRKKCLVCKTAHKTKNEKIKRKEDRQTLFKIL